MIAIEELIKLVPPPEHPEQIENLDWVKIESKNNINLPEDYKMLVSTYGSGVIGDFIWLLNPFSQNNNLNFNIVEYIFSGYDTLKKEFSDMYQRPKFPNKGSFFPWAITDNGDTLIWIIDKEKKPNSWKVGIQDSDPADEEIFDIGVIDLLINLINKKIKSNIFPEDFPLDNIRFVTESDYTS